MAGREKGRNKVMERSASSTYVDEIKLNSKLTELS